MALRRTSQAQNGYYCRHCGLSFDHWPGCPALRCERHDAYTLFVERAATPDEVDEGCELGVAYDPCPDCAASATLPRVDPARTSKE